MADKRNKDGTFAPGNPGGPGRPTRITESAYLRVVMDACTLDEWQEVVAKCVEAAKAGDPKAREWLASYLVGRPSAAKSAPSLSRMLAEEAGGIDRVDHELEQVKRERASNWAMDILSGTLDEDEDED